MTEARICNKWQINTFLCHSTANKNPDALSIGIGCPIRFDCCFSTLRISYIRKVFPSKYPYCFCMSTAPMPKPFLSYASI